MNDNFGNWLAGISDGEACFGLRAQKGRAVPSARYDLALRDDDSEMLETIKSTLGFGQVYYARKTSVNPQGYVSKPRATFCVWNKGDCLKLVEVFEKYPLRSKKHRDFVLWSEAVRLWNTRTTTGAWGRDPIQLTTITRMQELAKLIVETRAYPS
jgi:hypothetical protein